MVLEMKIRKNVLDRKSASRWVLFGESDEGWMSMMGDRIVILLWYRVTLRGDMIPMCKIKLQMLVASTATNEKGYLLPNLKKSPSASSNVP